jgi:uncharacterized protein (TIGR03435 family)
MAFGQSKFEAADIHVSPRSRTPFFSGPLLRSGHYELRNATMLDLISTAYGMDGDDVWGGPSWLEMDHFDLIAKAPAKLKPEEQKAMLQALLADRFKLVVHNDSKPMPAFALTAGKHPLLKKTDEEADKASDKPADKPVAKGCQYTGLGADGKNAGPGNPATMLAATCHNMTMKAFAEGMRNMPFTDRYLNRSPVVDRTELEGAWDITFKYSFPPRPGLPTTDIVTFADAIEKQLGLKLDAVKIPLPVTIVDSVNETPTPNMPKIAEILGNTAPPTEFDVATIKPTAPDFTGQRFQLLPGGKVNLQGVTLKLILQQIWNLPEEMIVGAPKWMGEDRYDITAKPPASALSDTSTQGQNGPDIDFEAVLAMVRNLITDRFKMVSHTEDRPISAYTLTAVKPKMKKADPASRTRFKEGPAAADAKNDPRNKMPILGRLVTAQNVTMAYLAEQLQFIASGYVHTSVLDSTGLTGGYDFTLSFSPACALQPGGCGGGGRGGDGAASGSPAADSQGASDPTGAVSLMDAMEKQLGLKLEKQTRPVSVLVIDHIERKPTEN